MRIILCLLCLLCGQQLFSQENDARIGSLIANRQWLELNREMTAPSAATLSPLLRQMGDIMTAHYFNRPQEACAAIDALLRNHASELQSDNVVGMMLMLAANLGRLNRYQEAADIVTHLVRQFEAQGADAATVAQFKPLSDRYAAYAAEGEVCRPLHRKADYRIPFTPSEQSGNDPQHSLLVAGSINHSPQKMLLDTGAGMHVMSSRQAQECGLRFSTVTIPMSGVGQQTGRLAWADTLSLGEMKWHNVPFLVVDIRTGNAEADRKTENLPPVLGMPLMLNMEELLFDFRNHELQIPASPTPRPFPHSNLMRTDGECLQVESCDEENRPLVFHFDTGCYGTLFSAHWYARHREVAQRGCPDSVRMGGVGGVHLTQSYRLPHVTFRLGSGEATLDSVQVSTGRELRNGQPLEADIFNIEDIDGVMGLNLLEAYDYVRLNFRDMYIEAGHIDTGHSAGRSLKE